MALVVRSGWLAFVLVGAGSGVAGAQELRAKQVAAPAADVLAGVVRLPDAGEHPTTSRAALVQVELAWDQQAGWAFETTLPVPVRGPLALGLLAPGVDGWRLRARGADGELHELERFPAARGVQHGAQVLSDGLAGWIVQRHDVAEASAGSWTLVVDVPGTGPHEVPATGFLIARDAAPVALAVHGSTLLLVSDSEIALVARLVHERTGATLPYPVDSARAIVRTERGTVELALQDDGLHHDGAAGDGVFGALLPAGTQGEVRALVQVRAELPGKGEFLRGAQLHFTVLERRVILDGSALARVEDEQRLRIELGALALGAPKKLQTAAELWGTNQRGELVPVCWLARMVGLEDLPEQAGEWRLPLFLDGRWLDVAGAGLPLELRNVRLQDPDTHVVFDVLERVPLAVGALPAVVGRGGKEVTLEMLTGLSAGAISATSVSGKTLAGTPALVSRALLLVHGYCSGGSIWPAADFTQPKLNFLDPDANRSHDEFAQLLAQAGGALYSFGVVGHSQGGAAALHLFTYYQSPLDLAEGPRRIQSVATPYQGTPLASFGSFACGVNDNLTPSGAATWLAGIPTWARAEVYYWTTSNSGSACNFLTSLLLSDPEDGTVEQFRGELPGGNDMGHVTGWCHTTGMSNPANYLDSSRNVQMDAAAAR